MLRFGARLVLLSLVAVLGGCTLLGKDTERTYPESRGTRPLEVPPDLIRPAGDSRMTIPESTGSGVESAAERPAVTDRPAAPARLTTSERPTTSERSAAPQGLAAPADVPDDDTVLPQYPTMQIRREGNVRWLEVKATPAQLWPSMRRFWQERGVTLAEADPDIGLMETEWIEDKAGVPQTGVKGLLTQALSNIAEVGLRDKYRVRLERQDDDTTALYLTHLGAEQVVEEDLVVWEPRASDPDREAEYLTRLMVFLGASEAVAQRALDAAPASAPAASLSTVNDRPVLQITDDFDKVWPRLGVSLDRAGLPVLEQDRDKGIYYIRYLKRDDEDRGMVVALLGRDDALQDQGTYEVHLTAQAGQTLVTAHDREGRLLAPAAAERLLKRLQASLSR